MDLEFWNWLLCRKTSHVQSEHKSKGEKSGLKWGWWNEKQAGLSISTVITRTVASPLLWFTFEKNDNGQKVAVFFDVLLSYAQLFSSLFRFSVFLIPWHLPPPLYLRNSHKSKGIASSLPSHENTGVSFQPSSQVSLRCIPRLQRRWCNASRQKLKRKSCRVTSFDGRKDFWDILAFLRSVFIIFRWDRRRKRKVEILAFKV